MIVDSGNKLAGSYKEGRCQVLSKVPLVALFVENLEEVVVDEVHNEADFAQGLPCLPRKEVIDPAYIDKQL